MERTIQFKDPQKLPTLFGKYDGNLKLIEKELKVRVVRNEVGLRISGERPQVDKACDLFDYLLGILDTGGDIKTRDIIYALKLAQPDEGVDFKQLAKEKIEVSIKGTLVTPRPKDRSNTWMPSNITTLFSVSARREPEKLISLWPWRSMP